MRKIITFIICIGIVFSLNGCAIKDYYDAVRYNKAVDEYNNAAYQYNYLSGTSTYKILNHKNVDMQAFWIEVYLISGCFWAVLCHFVAKKKGYPKEQYFKHIILGFLLGIIWFIVLLIRGNYIENIYSTPTVKPVMISDRIKDRNNQEDITGLIEKLADLKEKGIITEEEFTTKKTELLNKL